MSREPESNLRYMCSDCVKDRYPRAGSFTPDEVKAATYVKANFGGEHMWLDRGEVTEQGVFGTVANDPSRPGSPPFGEKVFIAFGNIEELGKF